MPRDALSGMRRRNVGALVLLLVGSLQLIGAITNQRMLRGVGAATAMAPLPKVFSDVDGLETFASEFTVHYRDSSGVTRDLLITPAVYGRLGGPYNRRNVYGAALSYAPRLPESLWHPVYCHGMAPHGPLRRELGLQQTDTDLSFTIRTRTRGRSDQWTYAPVC